MKYNNWNFSIFATSGEGAEEREAIQKALDSIVGREPSRAEKIVELKQAGNEEEAYELEASLFAAAEAAAGYGGVHDSGGCCLNVWR